MAVVLIVEKTINRFDPGPALLPAAARRLVIASIKQQSPGKLPGLRV
jgi:hypothetical protein